MSENNSRAGAYSHSGAPLLVSPEFLRSVQRHGAGVAGPFSKQKQKTPARRVGGTATMQIRGVIVPEGHWLQIFGAISADEIGAEFDALVADPNIAHIVLDIDSPGGAVNGISELDDKIFAARATKRITAFTAGTAASAAYWIASSAHRIVITATADVGSIGVVGISMDDRGRQANEGVIFHEVVSSNAPNKRPDLRTDEGIAVLQQMVDDLAAVFEQKISRNRGVTVDIVRKNYGQGASLVGSRAVAAGLADALGVIDAAGNAFLSQASASVQTFARQQTEDPDIRGEFLSPEHLAAYMQAASAGKIKTLGKNSRAASVRPALPAGQVALALPPTDTDVDAFCAKQWAADPKIRSEFGDLKIYAAYMKATGAGRCRVLNGPGGLGKFSRRFQ